MDNHASKLEREWSRVGAEVRLGQIQEEMAAIYRAFPELRGRSASAEKRSGGGKRAFSSSGKRAISDGMRKYWAKRKAREAKAAKGASRS